MSSTTQSRYNRSENGRVVRRQEAQRLKLACLAAYSNGSMQCNQCGFSNPDALALDHILNNGADDRRRLGLKTWGGQNFYHKLVKAGFPAGLQVLCHNCNWLKEVERRRHKATGSSF